MMRLFTKNVHTQTYPYESRERYAPEVFWQLSLASGTYGYHILFFADPHYLIFYKSNTCIIPFGTEASKPVMKARAKNWVRMSDASGTGPPAARGLTELAGAPGWRPGSWPLTAGCR